MKRKIACLALPLVFISLILGVIWRRNHPTPTKEDLEIRAMMLKSVSREAIYSPNNGGRGEYRAKLSLIEMRALMDQFFLVDSIVSLPLSSKPKPTLVVIWNLPPVGHGVEERAVRIEIPPDEAAIYFGDARVGRNYRVHPVTAKSWIKLFLNHSIIGPQLRKRIN